MRDPSTWIAKSVSSVMTRRMIEIAACEALVEHGHGLLLDEIRDHVEIAAAQHAGHDVGGQVEQEHKHDPGENARQAQRQRHVKKGLEAVRAQRGRGDLEIRLDILEYAVDREDHERQRHENERDGDARLVEQQWDGPLDDAKAEQRPVDDSVVAEHQDQRVSPHDIAGEELHHQNRASAPAGPAAMSAPSRRRTDSRATT